ncbi:MAG: phosphatase PAP2 family protein [Verrucomicrobiales bacterium]|nr:phosphatase PAP2 family protein [Verrucomicrobiales bacterium]MBP9223612.1 phosphatase PAP2 family protein [Verrucomicrobiales bacterium]
MITTGDGLGRDKIFTKPWQNPARITQGIFYRGLLTEDWSNHSIWARVMTFGRFESPAGFERHLIDRLMIENTSAKLATFLEPIPLLLLLILHGFIYNEIGELSAARGVDFGPLIETPWDLSVPFLPIFVIAYLFAWGFPALLIGYLLFATKINPKVFRITFISQLALMLSCYALWISFPVNFTLTVDDARLAEKGWLGQWVAFNYNIASDWNACPSFHVAGPWFLYRTTKVICPQLPKFFLVIVLAICVSTVLIRIHFLVDIPCGFLISEAAIRLVFIPLWKRKSFETFSARAMWSWSAAILAIGWLGFAYLTSQ